MWKYAVEMCKYFVDNVYKYVVDNVQMRRR